jgi:hypothetical protein
VLVGGFWTSKIVEMFAGSRVIDLKERWGRPQGRAVYQGVDLKDDDLLAPYALEGGHATVHDKISVLDVRKPTGELPVVVEWFGVPSEIRVSPEEQVVSSVLGRFPMWKPNDFYELTINDAPVPETMTFAEVPRGVPIICDVPEGDVSIAVWAGQMAPVDLLVSLDWDAPRLNLKLVRKAGYVEAIEDAQLQLHEGREYPRTLERSWDRPRSLDCLGVYPGARLSFEEPPREVKPAIYLYPEATTKVRVELSFTCEFTCVYPGFDDTKAQAWDVTAQPTGRITLKNGRTVPYLFWEGYRPLPNSEWDSRSGFLVKGKDAEPFLEASLRQLGLNDDELFEFVVYWAPLLSRQELSFVRFLTDVYAEHHPIVVEPSPTTQIRVFMLVQPGSPEMAADVTPQTLRAPAREGFTLVEWGGAMRK